MPPLSDVTLSRSSAAELALGKKKMLALPLASLGLRLAVTGANGYLGCEVAWQAVAQGHTVRAVVRSGSQPHHLPECEVMRVDDLTDAVSAREAADGVDAVIHTASVFQRCDDMEEELVKPNIALAEQMICACAASGARLVLTSSMAAVRGAKQPPAFGDCYCADDWNTVSRRDGPGFEPYQYSKAESERRAWQIGRQVGAEMVSLCPSMIFGPPRDPACKALSVAMVRKWVDGEAPVESRLVVDVRDAAQAHLAAATLPDAAGRRYVVSCEARVPAADLAAAIRHRLRAAGDAAGDAAGAARAARVHTDDGWDGGAVPVGAREVAAEDVLWRELGVRCRSTEETLADMAAVLVK